MEQLELGQKLEQVVVHMLEPERAVHKLGLEPERVVHKPGLEPKRAAVHMLELERVVHKPELGLGPEQAVHKPGLEVGQGPEPERVLELGLGQKLELVLGLKRVPERDLEPDQPLERLLELGLGPESILER